MLEVRLSSEVYKQLSKVPIYEEELWGIGKKDEIVILGKVEGYVDFEKVLQFPTVDFIFHTHPNEPTPSNIDIETAKDFPILWAVLGRAFGLLRVVTFYSARPFTIVDERRVSSREEKGVFIARRPTNTILRMIHPSPISKVGVYLLIRLHFLYNRIIGVKYG
ncbi:MAG: hypothetical protein QXT84_02735 [Candidatus Bathyarchaeia archaeon]